jgi:hypothetical protein
VYFPILRFLRFEKEGGHWEDVTDHPKIPREKVGTHFREFAKSPDRVFEEMPELPGGCDPIDPGVPLDKYDAFFSNPFFDNILVSTLLDEMEEEHVNVAGSEVGYMRFKLSPASY